VSVLIAVTWLLVAALVAVALYRATFAAAYLWRGLRSQGGESKPLAPLHRFAVVVPAHDEELLIGDLIRSIRAADYPADRVEIHVVADNCTDATAAKARELGARVAERHEPEDPGKGQALAWLFGQLDLSPYDAVAVIDADNLVDPAFFAAMNRELGRGARCLQGYDGIANPGETVMTRMLTITYVMKNLLFNAGKAALGLSVTLHGTGMVLRREVIEQHGWGAMSIGEDLEQSLQLVRRGERIVFVSDAMIGAQESSTLRQAYVQRQRWATGRASLAKSARSALWEGLRSRSLRLVDIAIDLLIPTYARMLSLTLLALVLAWLVRRETAGPLVVAIGVLAYQVVEVGIALRLMRASPRFIASLAFAPIFLAWKIPIDVLAALGHRREVWARTERRHHTSDDGRP
jgi:cellulose synthase/poly-beta-1,6-N-acetylglucosamine synthase-like glycosyltransferase